MIDPRHGQDAAGDDTIELRRAPPTASAPRAATAGRRWMAPAAGAAALLLAVAVWLLVPRAAPPPTPAPPPPAVAPPAPALPAPALPAPAAPAPALPTAAPPITTPAASPPAAPPPAPVATTPVPTTPPTAAPFAVLAGDEAAIAAHSSETLTVFRFAPAPDVVVLDFPDLTTQGRTLNRVAALVEKAGQPHDRVLNDAELERAIKAHGDTVASYYYGHDYSAASLARFFALADRDGVALGAEEERLRALLRQLAWLPAREAAPSAQPPTPPPTGALISVSRAGADAEITPAARATILHHELSHGAYFTDPRYAQHVRMFWQHTVSARERTAIRGFLAGEGYDPTDEELIVNEMQAYLIYTHDPDYFDITAAGLTPSRRAQLEAAFRRDLPDGWIRGFPAAAPMIHAAPDAPPTLIAPLRQQTARPKR